MDEKNAVAEISEIKNIDNGIFYLVIVGGHPFLNTRNPILSVRVNGKYIGESEILPRTNVYLFPLKLSKPYAKIELLLDRVFEKEKGGDPRELGMMVDLVSIVLEKDLSSPIFTKGWLPLKITEESLLLVEKGEIMLFNLKKEDGKKFVVFFFEPPSELKDVSYTLFIKLNDRPHKKFRLKNGIRRISFPLKTCKNIAKLSLYLKTEDKII